jgi:hypothetical protein
VNRADAGLNQIQSGLAWHYKKYEREQSTEDRVAYARAEKTAFGQSGAVSGAVATRCRRGSSVGTERSAARSPSRPRGSTGSTRPSAPRSRRCTPATTSPRRRASRSSAIRPMGTRDLVEMRWGSSPTRRRPPTAPSTLATLAPRPWPRSRRSAARFGRGAARVDWFHLGLLRARSRRGGMFSLKVFAHDDCTSFGDCSDLASRHRFSIRTFLL